MLRTAVGICKEEGILRLWQGVSPSLARHVVYSGVRITIYEKLRELIVTKPNVKPTLMSRTNSDNRSDTGSSASSSQSSQQSTLSLHHRILCGMTSGAVGQFCASPTDLIKVRMQMEGRRRLVQSAAGEAVAPTSNMMQIFLEIVRKGGITSLWKGINVHQCINLYWYLLKSHGIKC